MRHELPWRLDWPGPGASPDFLAEVRSGWPCATTLSLERARSRAAHACGACSRTGPRWTLPCNCTIRSPSGRSRAVSNVCGPGARARVRWLVQPVCARPGWFARSVVRDHWQLTGRDASSSPTGTRIMPCAGARRTRVTSRRTDPPRRYRERAAFARRCSTSTRSRRGRARSGATPRSLGFTIAATMPRRASCSGSPGESSHPQVAERNSATRPPNCWPVSSRLRCARPSTCLWLVSPWISDVELLDNTCRQLRCPDPLREAAESG